MKGPKELLDPDVPAETDTSGLVTFLGGPMRFGQATSLLGRCFAAGDVTTDADEHHAAWSFTDLRAIVSEPSYVDLQVFGGPAQVPDGQAGPEPRESVTLGPDEADRLISLLSDLWVDSTRYSSSFDQIYSHPAAQLLVRLGGPVVRYALSRLAAEPEHWSWVLSTITGAQPLSAETTRAEASQVWRQWAEANGWV